MRAAALNLLLFVLALAAVAGLSLHIVNAGEPMLLLRQGQLIRVETRPGLHWNLPLIDSERPVDTRPASLAVPPGAPMLTADHQQAAAGIWMVWRITDPARYWSAFGADAAAARTWLAQAAAPELIHLTGQAPLAALEAGGDATALSAMRRRIDAAAAARGLAVLAVRLGPVVLPEAALSAIGARMAAASDLQAATLRAAAADAVQRINTVSRRQVDAVRAAAAAQARETAAAAARQAAAIRAAAYAQSPAFYRYWRGLTTLQQGMQDGRGVVVLDRHSPLMQFLPPPSGR